MIQRRHFSNHWLGDSLITIWHLLQGISTPTPTQSWDISPKFSRFLWIFPEMNARDPNFEWSNWSNITCLKKFQISSFAACSCCKKEKIFTNWKKQFSSGETRGKALRRSLSVHLSDCLDRGDCLRGRLRWFFSSEECEWELKKRNRNIYLKQNKSKGKEPDCAWEL